MAEDLNILTVTGRLGKDPETREMQNGNKVTNLWIAVNGRKDDDVIWMNVAVFGKQGEAAEKMLAKGRKIGASGRLSVREYLTKDGESRKQVELYANSWYFMDNKPSESAGASAPGDSDIPF